MELMKGMKKFSFEILETWKNKFAQFSGKERESFLWNLINK